MTELERLQRGVRIAPETVRRVVQAIAEYADPECIVLFGSYAGGAPDAGSDLDLLVVMDSDLPRHKRSLPLRDLLEQRPPMDLLVYTPEEVRYWNGTVNHIVTKAFKTGTVVYESPRGGVFEPVSTRHEEMAREFLKKAENDLVTARYVLDMENGPTDTPAFHTQQAAEKALKAWLTFQEREAPRTHALDELLKMVANELPGLQRYEADLEEMSKYGVETRYPGRLPEPPREEVRRMLEVAEAAVNAVRERLAPEGDAR